MSFLTEGYRESRKKGSPPKKALFVSPVAEGLPKDSPLLGPVQGVPRDIRGQMKLDAVYQRADRGAKAKSHSRNNSPTLDRLLGDMEKKIGSSMSDERPLSPRVQERVGGKEREIPEHMLERLKEQEKGVSLRDIQYVPKPKILDGDVVDEFAGFEKSAKVFEDPLVEGASEFQANMRKLMKGEGISVAAGMGPKLGKAGVTDSELKGYVKSVLGPLEEKMGTWVGKEPVVTFTKATAHMKAVLEEVSKENPGLANRIVREYPKLRDSWESSLVKGEKSQYSKNVLTGLKKDAQFLPGKQGLLPYSGTGSSWRDVKPEGIWSLEARQAIKEGDYVKAHLASKLAGSVRQPGNKTVRPQEAQFQRYLETGERYKPREGWREEAAKYDEDAAWKQEPEKLSPKTFEKGATPKGLAGLEQKANLVAVRGVGEDKRTKNELMGLVQTGQDRFRAGEAAKKDRELEKILGLDKRTRLKGYRGKTPVLERAVPWERQMQEMVMGSQNGRLLEEARKDLPTGMKRGNQLILDMLAGNKQAKATVGALKLEGKLAPRLLEILEEMAKVLPK